MKNFRLSRRACLKGAGVALGLPMLEAMLPFGRRARAQAAAAGKPLRLLVWTFPDGVRMDAWTPTTAGAGYASTPILQPLDPWKSKLNVISGLANTPASVVSGNIFAGSHARATGAMLTQVPLTFTSGSNFKAGISFDQVIANALKVSVPSLRLPSLEIGAVYAGATGNCEDGFSCAYLTNLAWSGPTTFLPKETNPKAVFDRLTAGGLPTASTTTTTATPPPVDKALVYRKSVLDLVAADTSALKSRLGKSDQAKLSDYLDSVNELERRIAAMTPAPTPGTPPSSTPMAGGQCVAIPAPRDGTYLGRDSTKNIYGYTEIITAMNDLIAMSFACDLTRVVTFMSEIPLDTQTNFAFVGVDSSNYHDDISHHHGDPVKLAGIQTVNTFYAQQFAYLLGKLATTFDADGSSVLDNCAIIFTSEFGDGDNHYHYDLPVVLAGRAGGAFATGRHIHYASTPDSGAGSVETARRADKPLADLYISIMQAFGLDVTTFGSVDGTTPYGTAPLSELAG
ncbi:MAG TPA: DUF1552 domain-containing protein [Polyangia bacterium]|nr:DUF1552 domain-containing protein [Polyangia bacterium]